MALTEQQAQEREAALSPTERSARKQAALEAAARHQAAKHWTSSIRAAAREPESMKWEAVLVSQDALTLCFRFRARNGFGGFTKEFISIQNGMASQKAGVWNQRCSAPKFFDLTTHFQEAQ